MITRERTFAFVSSVLIVSCLLACGSVTKVREAADRMKRSNDLKQLVLAAHEYHDEKKALPADQQSFLLWAQTKAPEAVPVIQRTGPGGDITYFYAPLVLIKDFPQGMSNVILAVDNNPVAAGRIVAFVDGSVQVIPQAQLDAAPKAGKK